jgi:hypothetical protein
VVCAAHDRRLCFSLRGYARYFSRVRKRRCRPKNDGRPSKLVFRYGRQLLFNMLCLPKAKVQIFFSANISPKSEESCIGTTHAYSVGRTRMPLLKIYKPAACYDTCSTRRLAKSSTRW